MATEEKPSVSKPDPLPECRQKQSCTKAEPTSCCHAAQPQLVMAKWYVRTGTQLNLTFPGIVFGRTTTKLGLKLGLKRNNPQNAMRKGKTNIMLSCCASSASNGEVVCLHRDSAEPNVSWHRLRLHNDETRIETEQSSKRHAQRQNQHHVVMLHSLS